MWIGFIDIKTFYRLSPFIDINFNRINLFFNYLISNISLDTGDFIFISLRVRRIKSTALFLASSFLLISHFSPDFSSESFYLPEKSIRDILASGSTAKEVLPLQKEFFLLKENQGNAPEQQNTKNI